MVERALRKGEAPCSNHGECRTTLLFLSLSSKFIEIYRDNEDSFPVWCVPGIFLGFFSTYLGEEGRVPSFFAILLLLSVTFLIISIMILRLVT